MSTSCPRKYDVFISFRGEDVRATFISHLRSALSRHNIKAYADDNDLEKGDEVWPSLSQAIQDSELAIVVFSQNYADSKWCLNELVEILHCRKTLGLVVIPVFYEVDPSHIRKYSGTYGEAIAKHKDNESIQDWKAALAEAANISGWDSRSRDYKDESQITEKIVEDVSEKLSLRSPVELKVQDLVQIEKNCEQVKLLLSKNQKYHQLQENVQVIGIWGMGGIGKTTIAKALFSQLFPQYDAVCFLANVREESKRIGLISLCDKLLSDLLKEGHHKYNLAGSTFILRRLSHKKVLIVLDDVDSLDQLNKLCELRNYVGPDSKLIITTRNRDLLTGRVDDIYEVKEWSFAKPLELFCLHAFPKRHTSKRHEDLSKWAVEYVRGVSLALKVLGSNLHSRSTKFWDGALNKLKKCSQHKIQDVNQVSCDGLDDLEKEIFQDIAFIFKSEHKNDVIRMLDGCDFCTTSGVEVLEDKALITISHFGTIQMHDLNIVGGGSKDPGKRCQLREIEGVSDVLENKKGSDLIEGIKLDLSPNADAFDKMTNLSSTGIEILDSSKRPRKHQSLNVHDLKHGKLPNELFSLEYLCELRICNGGIAIEGGMLDVLFSRATSLRVLHLKNCCNLSELPTNMYGLLNLYELILDGSCVKTLPVSIRFPPRLNTLSLENCRKLESLPELPTNVAVFIAVNCRSLRTISTLTNFLNNTWKGITVSLQNCNLLESPSLHYIMVFAHLATKSAVLESVINKEIMHRGRNTKINHNYESVKFCFPGSKVPRQFKYQTEPHFSVTVDLHSSPQLQFVGLILCVVLSPSREMKKNLGVKIWCQCYLADGKKLGPATTWDHKAVPGLNSDHVFMWCDSSHFSSIFDTETRRVSFKFFVTNDMEERVTIHIPECGVYLIFRNQYNNCSCQIARMHKCGRGEYGLELNDINDDEPVRRPRLAVDILSERMIQEGLL